MYNGARRMGWDVAGCQGGHMTSTDDAATVAARHDPPTVQRGGPFVCPKDRAALAEQEGGLACPRCGTTYPVVRGIPVLIDDATSVFAISDYQAGGGYQGVSVSHGRGPRALLRRVLYALKERHYRASRCDAAFAIAHMLAARPDGRILVIGAGEHDFGDPRIVYTDVAFGPLASAICDAQALPFPDGHFTGVVAVAVLEHVADPWRCAEEMRRVLTQDGFIFADTPFLQPVHMGAYDFTRFTPLGHRRLFRYFDEIESGVSIGPMAALESVLQYTMLAVSDRRSVRRVVRSCGIVLGALLRPIGRLFDHTRGASDCAFGVFFFGRRRAEPLTDRELVTLYRGMG
jgi:SAM-dependent methyltransferase